MAAAPVTQPLLKSQPDMSKLNTFTGYTVGVTKHLGPRNTPGSSVVATQTMTKEALLALQATLPLKEGPGYFLFQVTDTGGTGEDQWMVKLGVDSSVPQQQEGYPMAGPGFPGQYPAPSMPPAAPLDGDVKQIMPGFFFNEGLGLLRTPWGETVPWRQTDAWPKAPTGSATHLASVPASATPWNWPPQQGSSWGGYPIGGGSSSEVETLKAELVEQKRQREMDELRADQRRRDDEQRRREEERDRKDSERIAEDRRREDQRREEARRYEDQRAKEMQAMFERLTALTAKPAGPSEHEQRIERELLEEKRRREDGEREAARREEDRRRDEQHRTELAAMNERVERTLREASATRTDPMMTVFKEVLILAASLRGCDDADDARSLRRDRRGGRAQRHHSAAGHGDGARRT